MKRFLHALAALWPKRKEVGNPPTPPTSTGLRQHLAAVLRMEGILGECADLRICKSANETLGASALNTVRDQLPESPDTRLVDSPDTRLPESSTQQLTESPDTRLIESPDTWLDDSPNQQFVDSPNQPHSLPRIPQPMPLLTILMLVFFMCLMAAKQVSAQAEPAEAAKWIIPHGGVVLGDSLPDWFWELELSVVNHPEGKDIVRMADYKDKLLVLDFWATYCKPCIESLNKWNSLLPLFEGSVSVIAIHLYDASEKARPFAAGQGWTIPVAVGNSLDTVLNAMFYHPGRFGEVLIKDMKLFAYPKSIKVEEGLISDIVHNRRVELEMDLYRTHSENSLRKQKEYLIKQEPKLLNSTPKPTPKR